MLHLLISICNSDKLSIKNNQYNKTINQLDVAFVHYTLFNTNYKNLNLPNIIGSA